MPSITSKPIIDPPKFAPMEGLFTTRHLTFPYGNYDVSVQFSNHQGIMGVPVGKAAGSTGRRWAKIDLFAPVCRKTVVWTATRDGDFPWVPTAVVSASSGLTLESNNYWPLPPVLMLDGLNKTYGFSGVYVYLCDDMHEDPDDFPLSFPDYEQNTEEVFPSANFKTGIIG